MTTPRFRTIGLSRVSSVAVLALTASGGLALVTAAGPAAAVTPQDTPVPSSGYSLSIAVAQKSIHPGDSDSVSGVLTHGGVVAAGDTVYLRARPDGKRHGHRAASAMTGNDGSVSFNVTPSSTTHYRLVFRLPSATPPTDSPTPTPVSVASIVGARSKVATVHVLQNSSLSIRARQRGHSGHELIQGQLRGGGHALRGRQVALEERPVGSATWTTVATHHTNRHGMVSYGVATPTAPEEFALVFAGGPNFNGCQSGVVTVG